jgi:hypothetical protein
LNVLLTWATGGTPPGDVTCGARAGASHANLATRQPDTILDLPALTLAAGEQERVAEFTLAEGNRTSLRAIDVLPERRRSSGAPPLKWTRVETQARLRDERLLSLWCRETIPRSSRAPHPNPANAKLKVRIRYRKTWSYEGKALTDRSRVGLYFAPPPHPRCAQSRCRRNSRSHCRRRSVRLPLTRTRTFTNAGIILIATDSAGRRES